MEQIIGKGDIGKGNQEGIGEKSNSEVETISQGEASMAEASSLADATLVGINSVAESLLSLDRVSHVEGDEDLGDSRVSNENGFWLVNDRNNKDKVLDSEQNSDQNVDIARVGSGLDENIKEVNKDTNDQVIKSNPLGAGICDNSIKEIKKGIEEIKIGNVAEIDVQDTMSDINKDNNDKNLNQKGPGVKPKVKGGILTFQALKRMIIS